MKKTMCLLAAAFGMMVASADDLFLYWMVDVGDADAFAAKRGAEITSVRLHAVDGTTGEDTYLNLLAYNGDGLGESVAYSPEGVANTVLNYAGEGGVGFWASVAGVAKENFSYIVELYNGETWLGQSDSLPYCDKLLGEVITGSMLEPPDGMWVASAFAVPEPNSVLLLLFGCAALALRRADRCGRGAV